MLFIKVILGRGSTAFTDSPCVQGPPKCKNALHRGRGQVGVTPWIRSYCPPELDRMTEYEAFTALFTGHPHTVYKLNSMCLNNAGLKQMFTLKSE